MGNFLINNQKQEIRVKINEDIILYEPTELQLEELKNILKEHMKIDEGMNGEVELSYKYIRWIIRMLVKDGDFIDEYSDDEMEQLIENGNRNIKRLMNEITDMISEIGEDLLVEQSNLIHFYIQVLNILNANNDMKQVETKFNKLLKKNGYKNVSFGDVMSGKISPDILIKKKNKK